MEEENTKIKGELQSWNDYYNQEETSPEGPVSTPMITANFVPEGMSLFNFTSPMSMPMHNFPFERVTLPMLSEPSATTFTPAVSLAVEEHSWFPPSSDNMGQQQSSGRRVSFGSVFPGSSGNGDGNGDRRSSFGMSQAQVYSGSGSSTFNIGIKPKDPPFFHGRATEDVDTWITKVGDFLCLTEANP